MMRSEFAAEIDPIFIALQRLLGRIETGERLIVSDERTRLLKALDRAEQMLGNSADWQLAKYALCGWIDSQLMKAPWLGRDWWSKNCLESQLFGSRISNVEYFLKASKAAQMPNKDALEVFYLGVMMGFRGFYDDENSEELSGQLNLPLTLQEWCAGVASSLQFKQGRPKIEAAKREGGTARPLAGRQALTNVSMISIFLASLAVSFYVIFASDLFGSGEASSEELDSPPSPPPALIIAS